MRTYNLRLLAGSVIALMMTSCSSVPQSITSPSTTSLAPVTNSYFSDLQKSGLEQTCPSNRKLKSFLPAMGGDAVILKRGINALIFDEGDLDTGDTLEIHDSLVIKHASPDKFKIEREGHSLKLCAPNFDYAITIMRQYCSGSTSERLWNNTIEEITFASGETWLSDHLYDKLNGEPPYADGSFLDRYGLSEGPNDKASNWQFFRFSEKLPAAGRAQKHCAADLE